MDLLEDIDLQTVIELADLHQWRCEDVKNHGLGICYHTPDAPAEFLIINKCCGDRALLCRSRVEYLMHTAEIRCSTCGTKWAPEDYRFIPLPEMPR
jgi:hypothetical protein